RISRQNHASIQCEGDDNLPASGFAFGRSSMTRPAPHELPTAAEALDKSALPLQSVMQHFGEHLRAQYVSVDNRSYAEVPESREHHLAFAVTHPEPVHRFYDGKHSGSADGSNTTTVATAGRSVGWQSDKPLEFLHLYVEDDQVQQLAREVLKRDSVSVEIFDSLGVRDKFIEDLAPVIMNLLQDDCPQSAMMLDSFHKAISLHLLRSYSNHATEVSKVLGSSGPVDNRIAEKAKAFIEENLDQPLTLESVGEAIGVSMFRLARTFKSTEGMTVHKYLIQRRLARSRELLATDTSLAEIALQTGFSSQSHMTSAFTKQMGMPPGKYRTLVRL
ncbi:MAG: AraC family transcriptional regulator, partial [Pseudomonadota bacterium]